MPLNSLPPTVDVAALRSSAAAAAGSATSTSASGAAPCPASLGGLAALHDAGRVRLQVLPRRQRGARVPAAVDRAELDRALAEVAALDALLIVHAEDAGDARRRARLRRRVVRRLRGLAPARGRGRRAIAGLLDGAARHGARVHVLHLSSAAALPPIAAARAAGVRGQRRDLPALPDAERRGDPGRRTRSSSAARRSATPPTGTRSGGAGRRDRSTASSPTTPPAPPTSSASDTGDFGEAWGGISSLQLGLPLVWTAARDRGIALDRRRPLDVAAPGRARRAGPPRARSRAGRDADLVVFAPDESFVVDPARLHHRNPVTPYAGRELTGAVRDVWLRGQRVVDRRRRRRGAPREAAQEGVT